MTESTLAPVRHELTVATDPATAFRVFTADIGRWWPPEHHIGASEPVDVRIEPAVGGKVCEIGSDGTECQWGQVLAWEPPGRLIVAWMLNARWEFDPDISHASEYEVTFSPAGEGETAVVFEHRNFERHGLGGESIQRAVGEENGWPGILARYVDLTSGVVHPR